MRTFDQMPLSPPRTASHLQSHHTGCRRFSSEMQLFEKAFSCPPPAMSYWPLSFQLPSVYCLVSGNRVLSHRLSSKASNHRRLILATFPAHSETTKRRSHPFLTRPSDRRSTCHLARLGRIRSSHLRPLEPVQGQHCPQSQASRYATCRYWTGAR